MELVETQGWERMMPLPTKVYSTLVETLLLCDLEIRTLENDECTIKKRVRGKNIVLTPSILSEIIGVPNARDNIFIDKPNTLDQIEHKRTLNEAISIRGTLGASQTKELKKKYRLFHRFIAYNVISKKEAL